MCLWRRWRDTASFQSCCCIAGSSWCLCIYSCDLCSIKQDSCIEYGIVHIEMAPPTYLCWNLVHCKLSCISVRFLPVYVAVHITTCNLVESAMCRICCEDRMVTCWHGLPMYATLKRKPCNFTTNTLKAYLSAQPSCLSAFMISKTHIVA